MPSINTDFFFYSPLLIALLSALTFLVLGSWNIYISLMTYNLCSSCWQYLFRPVFCLLLLNLFKFRSSLKSEPQFYGCSLCQPRHTHMNWSECWKANLLVASHHNTEWYIIGQTCHFGFTMKRHRVVMVTQWEDRKQTVSAHLHISVHVCVYICFFHFTKGCKHVFHCW